MKTKKMLAALLSAAMAITSAAIPVFADEVDEEAEIAVDEAVEEVADDGIELAADEPWEGAGTKAEPYKISSKEDLEALRDKVNDGSRYNGDYFELTQNIDLEGSEANQWEPIGKPNSLYFEGSFDGGGHTISGLYINKTEGYQGLFGYIGHAYEIKNFTLKGSVTGTTNVGGLVGYVYDGGLTIEKVTVDCGVEGTSSVGGIAGYSKADIVDCDNLGPVTGSGRYIGGIVGQYQYQGTVPGNIKDCTNSGKITGGMTTGVGAGGSGCVGGIVGNNNAKGSIIDCSNNGEVIGQGYAGGIVGDNNSSGEISGCKNSGTVTSSGDALSADAGGIIGYSNGGGAVKDCANTGNITSPDNVGGIVGYTTNTPEISGCYNTGDVTSNSNSGYAGGIVGSATSDIEISGSYNTGDVTCNDVTGYAAAHVGGLAGQLSGSKSSVKNAFNTGNVTMKNHSNQAGGVTGSGRNTTYENTYYQTGSCDNGGTGGSSGVADPDGVSPFGDVTELNDESFGGAENNPFDLSGGVPQIPGNIRELPPATEVGIYFKEHTDDPAAGMLELMAETLKARSYDIVVRAAAGTDIHELNTVDLTFANKGDVAYEIAPAKDFISIIDAGNDRYEFNFNTKDAEVIEGYDSGHEIIIGTVTFIGYGKVDFSIKEFTEGETDTNIVTTTKTEDNIVDEFITNGDISDGKGKLTFNTTEGEYLGKIGGEGSTLDPETVPLEINVMFPNTVDEQAAGYTNMTVSLHSALDDKHPIDPIELGGDKVDTVTYHEAGADYAKYTTTASVLTDTRYTITFSGEGYRTYSVDFVIPKDAVSAAVEVWNNAMDEAKRTVVTYKSDAEGESTILKSATDGTTFLAGDIDDSKNIDLYDLSAAVAYFGKTGMDKNTTIVDDVTTYTDANYIRYDLNRDGSIDSKDIAMVLVSWGK